jgi:hypothetical protein
VHLCIVMHWTGKMNLVFGCSVGGLPRPSGVRWSVNCRRWSAAITGRGIQSVASPQWWAVTGAGKGSDTRDFSGCNTPPSPSVGTSTRTHSTRLTLLSSLRVKGLTRGCYGCWTKAHCWLHPCSTSNVALNTHTCAHGQLMGHPNWVWFDIKPPPPQRTRRPHWSNSPVQCRSIRHVVCPIPAPHAHAYVCTLTRTNVQEPFLLVHDHTFNTEPYAMLCVPSQSHTRHAPYVCTLTRTRYRKVAHQSRTAQPFRRGEHAYT